MAVDLPQGRRILTLHPALQARMEAQLRSIRSPYSAIVALEPFTGRVLAMAEHSEVNPSLRGLTTKAVFPAASVFKVITTAALLRRGLRADDLCCWHGGGSMIARSQLLDSDQDRSCHTLSEALGRSINAVFAKLTFKYLTAALLRSRAHAFGFNQPLDFPIPTDISRANFNSGPVRVAATGAGFGDVYLSPLHGAAIASVIATGGRWRQPILFEHQEQDTAGTSAEVEVMTPLEAAALTQMLQQTVTEGTARRVFGEDGSLLDAVGKTGTLSDVNARQYSWFIGFAPRTDPQIAIAAVTVSEPGKKTPAAVIGREALRYYLAANGLTADLTLP